MGNKKTQIELRMNFN